MVSRMKTEDELASEFIASVQPVSAAPSSATTTTAIRSPQLKRRGSRRLVQTQNSGEPTTQTPKRKGSKKAGGITCDHCRKRRMCNLSSMLLCHHRKSFLLQTSFTLTTNPPPFARLIRESPSRMRCSPADHTQGSNAIINRHAIIVLIARSPARGPMFLKNVAPRRGVARCKVPSARTRRRRGR